MGHDNWKSPMLVESMEAFDKNYPYAVDYIGDSDYPESYPCVMVIDHEDGGLGGDHYAVYLHYPPAQYDLTSWVAGFVAGKYA